MTGLSQTSLLVLAAAFGAFTAAYAGVAPQRFAQQLGLTPTDPGGVNEIRAQYAFFFLGVGVACAAALAGATPRAPVFLVLTLVFGGLFSGRVVALVLNRGVAGYGPTILALHAVDLVLFLWSASALTQAVGLS